MRRMLVVGTAVSLIGLAAAAGGGVSDARGQQSADAEGVRAAAAAFYAALSARDIRAMEALWSREADTLLIAPGGRSPVVGWGAVRPSLKVIFARFTELSVSTGDPQVRVGRDAALVVAVTPVRGRTPGGEVSYTALGTTAFERRDGRWLVVHHHASQVPQ